jgi:Na+/H+-dicarboxylate symporter
MSCRKLLEKLKGPRFVLFSLVLGAAAGRYSPAATEALAPFSTLFFALLKMCALPIVVTAVILSFARLWDRPGASRHLARLAVIFLSGVLPIGLAGAITGAVLGKYLAADPSAFSAISDLLGNGGHGPASVSPGLLSLLLDMIPRNIFKALSEGQILGTLLFVIMLGVAIGFNQGRSREVLILSIESLNEAFFRMVGWVTYLLPFALCAITAQTIASLGNGAFNVLGRMIGVAIGGCFVLFLLQLLVTRLTLRESWLRLYRRLREPCLVGLTSCSSLATLPSLEIALHREPGISKGILDLMLPLGITFCQHSTVFFYSLVGAAITRLYGLPLGPTELLIIVAGSYLQSVAAAGLPAAASLGFLASIFRPLGLPVETLSVVLAAVMPIIEPILTLVNIAGYVASAGVMHRLELLAPARESLADQEQPVGDEALELP